MNTARSSLSTFINIDGEPVGQHPVITRFMKGVFNIKPALPKYNFTWDVGVVITYLSENVCDKNWRHSEDFWTLKPYWRNKIPLIS